MGAKTKGESGYPPVTASITATSIGPVTRSGKYQVSCTGSAIYIRQSTSQADAETVTPPSGSVRGSELFGGNAKDWYLDSGDYLGVITAAGTSVVNLHFEREF
ncbi:hypothetical protein [Nitrosomonas oligotropha]|uniref:hypothetical protein n=1 Tax=Nitrosomonas oligotropha TaxID=42354 RepID=UPI0013720935|nr:hypothetical protein [Nitrosomonas oligotropha]MXS81586.1 hypothetical protein [Nitrosomonas oligotropha]